RAVIWMLGRHLQAHQLGQFLDSLREAQRLGVHGEGDDVAMRPTAEAVVEALIVIDGEGWRLFVVKRAKSLEFPALALQPDALPDDLGHRQTVAQFVQEFGWKRHLIPAVRHSGSRS